MQVLLIGDEILQIEMIAEDDSGRMFLAGYFSGIVNVSCEEWRQMAEEKPNDA